MKYANYLYSLLFVASAGFAMPAVNESWTSYPINGSSAQQLNEEMARSGPLDNGEHYYANTLWKINWHYTYKENARTCEMTAVQVNTDITYKFPAWSGYANASKDLQHEWDALQLRLRQHEQLHAQNAKQAAIDIEVMLQHFPAATDCQTLQTAADNKAKQIITWYHEKDAAYDNETSHGSSQGAWLS